MTVTEKAKMNVTLCLLMVSFLIPFSYGSHPYMCLKDTKQFYFSLDDDFENMNFGCDEDNKEVVDVSVLKKADLEMNALWIRGKYGLCVDLYRDLKTFGRNTNISFKVDSIDKHLNYFVVNGAKIDLSMYSNQISGCLDQSDIGLFIEFRKYNIYFRNTHYHILNYDSKNYVSQVTKLIKNKCHNIAYDSSDICTFIDNENVTNYFVWDNTNISSDKYVKVGINTPFMILDKVGKLTIYKHGLIYLEYNNGSIVNVNSIYRHSTGLIGINNGYCYISIAMYKNVSYISVLKVDELYDKISYAFELKHLNTSFIRNKDDDTTITFSGKYFVNNGRFQHLYDVYVNDENRNLITLCKNYMTLRKMYLSLCKQNPYFCLRYLAKKSNMRIQFVGGRSIVVKPCIELTQYRIIHDFNYKKEKCPIFVPLEFSYKNVTFIGYVNPSTNEVFKESPLEYCESTAYLELNNTLIYISDNKTQVYNKPINTFGKNMFIKEHIAAVKLNNLDIEQNFDQSSFREIYDIAYHHLDEIMNPKEHLTHDWTVFDFSSIKNKIYLVCVIIFSLLVIYIVVKILNNCCKKCKFNIGTNTNNKAQTIELEKLMHPV